jgi:aryl-alcohol dehydrogenase-like predicted oxidoreductase
VVLCHEADIADPSVYLEAFEMLKQRGRIRAYGISTNDLGVLEHFNAHGTCSVVEVDYSLINRAPEADLLPYCVQHGIAVLVRGPLRRGLLAGKYDADSVFSDAVRAPWNAGEEGHEGYLREVGQVERLKGLLKPGTEMVTAALRYVISHPAHPVAIPGCKSPAQARMNAAAGERGLSATEIDQLRERL